MHKKPWQIVIALSLLVPFGIFAPLASTSAVDTSRQTFYDSGVPNSLISDSDFIAIDSMSVNDIQSFLTSQGSYLTQVSENGRSAAQIIYDAAHGSGEASGSLNGIEITTSTGTISPRSLLATLQKEQSLVTLTEADRASNPDSYTNRLNRAMGYGCPDSGGCNDKYKGFTNQVEWAAWQLRYNYEAAGQTQSWWNTYYPADSTQTCAKQYILNQLCSITNTQSNIGDGWLPPATATVTLTNRATAALYRYTPHTFNGNYNHWKFMMQWFGVGNTSASVSSVNDTVDVSTKTYGTTIKVSGSKASGDVVYYSGNQVAGSGSTSWEATLSPDVGTSSISIEYRNSSNQVIATKKVNVERRHFGDIDGDGTIELKDLSLLGESYGVGVTDYDWRDLNGDSVVDILDLSKLSEVWP